MLVLLEPLAETAVAICVSASQGPWLVEKLIADGASDQVPHGFQGFFGIAFDLIQRVGWSVTRYSTVISTYFCK